MVASIPPSARHPILAGCMLLVAATSASGQNLNIRLTTLETVPSPTYGAATGQAGVWNAVAHGTYPTSQPPTPLVDLAGAPTSAAGTIVNCDTGVCSISGYGPDVAALFRGLVNGDC